MKYIFLDTNIFIRFLARDNEKMFLEVQRLFELIDRGKLKATTDLIVIAEIVWVLSSFFKLDRQKICEYINLLVNMKNLNVKDSTMILEVMDIYQKSNADFIDIICLKLAQKKGINFICSYDNDFDKIHENGVERVEPGEIIEDY